MRAVNRLYSGRPLIGTEWVVQKGCPKGFNDTVRIYRDTPSKSVGNFGCFQERELFMTTDILKPQTYRIARTFPRIVPTLLGALLLGMWVQVLGVQIDPTTRQHSAKETLI